MPTPWVTVPVSAQSSPPSHAPYRAHDRSSCPQRCSGRPSWLWPGLTLAFIGIWTVNRVMNDLPILSLTFGNSNRMKSKSRNPCFNVSGFTFKKLETEAQGDNMSREAHQQLRELDSQVSQAMRLPGCMDTHVQEINPDNNSVRKCPSLMVFNSVIFLIFLLNTTNTY